MTHALNTVNAMKAVGYDISDMLPAFPGKNIEYIRQILDDTALASDRRVISYGLLGIRPGSTRYFNISEFGFRKIGEEQAWPPDRKKINMFFFGGSTTLGYCIEDRDTIPAKLKQKLCVCGVDCEVYNFGAGSYTIRHESLRLLDLIDQGIIPDYVIFLDGNNESVLGLAPPSLMGSLDQLYQSEKLYRKTNIAFALFEFLMQRMSGSSPNEMPETQHRLKQDPELADLMSDQAIEIALSQSNSLLRKSEIHPAGIRLAENVWTNYLNSVSYIRGLTKRLQITTIFAWQPVLWFATSASQRIMPKLFKIFRHSAFCSPVYHWLHAENFPEMSAAHDFINLSSVGVGIEQPLYVEYVHYNATFCDIIADRLAQHLLNRDDLVKRAK